MNPLVAQAIGSIVRWAFLLAAGYLVNAGIWGDSQATEYAAAAAIAVPVLAWSLWAKYRSRLKLVTALSIGSPISEKVLDGIVAEDPTPSVTTAKDQVPST